MMQPKIRCFVCHKTIVGRYGLDWAGHCVCSAHISLVVHCASCGQFCDGKAKDIGIGMKVCTHCQRYRIEKTECDHILQFIKEIYRKAGLESYAKWRLKMIDAETLYKMTNDKQTRGLAQQRGNEYTIYVYRELSRVAFAQVLAHEMLHVFQYSGRIKPPRAQCEGFCNLGSYVVLSSINNAEAKGAIKNLMENTDPIYGDGFRAMLRLYNQGGWSACLREIRGY